MAPANPPDVRGVDHRRDSVADRWEHPPHPGVEQQRLVVAYEEMIKLQVEVGHINDERCGKDPVRLRQFEPS
jgi:hypothetical protein